MTKRIGIRKAKKIFKKRSARSRSHDLMHTSKHVVLPYTKGAELWAKNPDRYDMLGIDTKKVGQPRIIGGREMVEVKTNGISKKAKKRQAITTRKRAEEIKREILMTFSPLQYTYIKYGTSTKELEKISNVIVSIRKSKGKYRLYLKAKRGYKDIFIQHPFIIQEEPLNLFELIKKKGWKETFKF
jgi:hypothetical protein